MATPSERRRSRGVRSRNCRKAGEAVVLAGRPIRSSGHVRVRLRRCRRWPNNSGTRGRGHPHPRRRVRTGPKRARRSDCIVALWVSWTGFVRQPSLRTEGLYNLSKIPWEFAIVQCPGVILSLLIVSSPLWFSVDQISFRFVQIGGDDTARIGAKCISQPGESSSATRERGPKARRPPRNGRSEAIRTGTRSTGA